MAGGTNGVPSIDYSKTSLGRYEQKQQQHQKQKPSEGKTVRPRGANAIRVPKNELDTADFLIDGLTSRRA